MMSDNIRQHHLDRRAILYVRQSSSHQVLHNRESRALQYAMRPPIAATLLPSGISPEPRCADADHVGYDNWRGACLGHSPILMASYRRIVPCAVAYTPIQCRDLLIDCRSHGI
jgi:hypothetical protein